MRIFTRPSAARLATVVCLAATWSWAAVPSPKDHFGFTPGDDYKLADYQQITGYFQKLAQASDRIRLVEFGKSSTGKPMYVAFISAAENLKRWTATARSAAGWRWDEATARRSAPLAAEGKAIVWIDSGLHATRSGARAARAGAGLPHGDRRGARRRGASART